MVFCRGWDFFGFVIMWMLIRKGFCVFFIESLFGNIYIDRNRGYFIKVFCDDM